MQKTAPTRLYQPHLPLVCPVWHSLLIHIVPDGIEVKCHSCRKTKHVISRARIEQIWDQFTEEDPCLRSESGAENT